MLRWWQNYWFRRGSLFDLAVCRIIIVGFQLYLLLIEGMLGELRRYSEMPNSLYDPLGVLHLLIWPMGWNYRPPFEVLEIVFGITITAGVLTIIGMKTNPALLLFTAGNLFLQTYKYSFGDFHHRQALMMIALFALSLSPAGQVLSLDDYWRRKRLMNKRQSYFSLNLLEGTSHFARWPLLLIQWMFALIFLSACFSKLSVSGVDWMNGYTLQFYMFRDALRWDQPLGIWLAQFHTLIYLGQWVVILFQGTFFLVLVYPVLARIYIPLALFFHTLVYMTMKAPFFQWMVIYVVFVPWAETVKIIAKRSGWIESMPKSEVQYE